MFEDLPNEIIISILEYLTYGEIVKSFLQLNSRIQKLCNCASRNILFNSEDEIIYPDNVRFIKCNVRNPNKYMDLLSKCPNVLYIDLGFDDWYWLKPRITILPLTIKNLKINLNGMLFNTIFVSPQNNLYKYVRYLELICFTSFELYQVLKIFANPETEITLRSFEAWEYGYKIYSPICVKRVIFCDICTMFINENMMYISKFTRENFEKSTIFIFKTNYIIDEMFINDKTFVHCYGQPIFNQSIELKSERRGNKIIFSKK